MFLICIIKKLMFEHVCVCVCVCVLFYNNLTDYVVLLIIKPLSSSKSASQRMCCKRFTSIMRLHVWFPAMGIYMHNYAV